MRAVEREPWAQRRSHRHDVLCASVAARRGLIFKGFTGEVRATVEAPCGRGFCDVLAVTDAPPGDVQVAIVEVKTNDEIFSAGDLIRQLKWYREQVTLPRGVRRRDVRLVAVFEDVIRQPDTMLELLSHEGIEVLPAWFFEEDHDAVNMATSTEAEAAE